MKPLTPREYNQIPELCAIPPRLFESIVRAIEKAHGITEGMVDGEALLKAKLNLLQTELYTHELLSNGGGTFLGVPEKGICEAAHDPGETSEEVQEWISVKTIRNLIK